MTDTPEAAAEASTVNLTPDTRVTLHALSLVEDRDQVIVGRIETGEFVALPDIGGRVIQHVQAGQPLAEVARLLEAEYGAEVDVEEFIVALIDLGFVKAIDGHELGDDRVQAPNLAWLKPHHVRWIYTWPVALLYGALLAAAGITMLRRPDLWPTPDDFFWTSGVSVPLFVSTVIFLGNLALHELSHLVAARSLGIPAHFHLGTRLHNLVIQTNVTGLWAVPRHQRYRVYAAGMLWDLIPMSIAVLLLAYAAPTGLVAALLPVVILMIFFGILTQFQFYMRTDVYFILLDLLRCYDLFEDGMRYVRDRLRRGWRLVHRQPTADLVDPLLQVAPHERPKVRFYAWLVVVGSTITLAVFFIYGLPIIVQLFVQAAQSLWTGITMRNLWLAVDGGVTLLIEGGLQVLFVFAFVRNRRHWFARLNRRASTASSVALSANTRVGVE